MSTEQARRVLSSLEAKPDLFFEVLRIAHDEFIVAGPWMMSATPGTARRGGVTGGLIGSVKPKSPAPNPAGPPYVWEFDGGCGEAPTLLQACHDLDVALVADGYLLAGGICPPA